MGLTAFGILAMLATMDHRVTPALCEPQAFFAAGFVARIGALLLGSADLAMMPWEAVLS